MAEPCEHQVDDPADGSDHSRREILSAWCSEQDRESECADEGGKALPQDSGGLGIDGHSAEFDHSSEHPSVRYEADTHAESYADESEHRVREPCQPGREVGPDLPDERNSQDERSLPGDEQSC